MSTDPTPAPNRAAKRVKVISTLAIVGGMFAWIVCVGVEAPTPYYNIGAFAFFGGFAGFVVGRFME